MKNLLLCCVALTCLGGFARGEPPIHGNPDAKVHFHYNSDLSGDVRIDDNDDRVVWISADALLKFVGERLRDLSISQLEGMGGMDYLSESTAFGTLGIRARPETKKAGG